MIRFEDVTKRYADGTVAVDDLTVTFPTEDGALTAVSGWLIVRAAEQPQILTLMIAIVAVRGSGLGRAVLRWLERLASHDAAFQLAGSTRLRLWSGLVLLAFAASVLTGPAAMRFERIPSGPRSRAT